MSESEEKYVERRGWNQPRTMDFRRNADKKAKAKMIRIAGGTGPKHGYVIDWDWDYSIDAPVKRKNAKRIWFTEQMRHCKKVATRKVRRSNDVANGSSYKKHFDIMWQIF